MFELTKIVILARYLLFWYLLIWSDFAVASLYTNSLGYNIWLNLQSTETRLTVSSTTWKYIFKRYSADCRRLLTERELIYLRAYISLFFTSCAADSDYINNNSIAIEISTVVSVFSLSDISQSQLNSELTTQISSLNLLKTRNQFSASTIILIFAEYTEASQSISCPQ